MKQRVVIIVLSVVGALALVLFFVALSRRPQELNEIIANNVVNQPLVSKPEEIPATITPADTTEIEKVVRLYFELLGDFDQRSDFENFNAAAAFATESLRTEMFAFVERSRAQVRVTEPLAATTSVSAIVVEKTTTATGQPQVVAHIVGELEELKGGVETITKFTGDVFVVQAGAYWFVA